MTNKEKRIRMRDNQKRRFSSKVLVLHHKTKNERIMWCLGR